MKKIMKWLYAAAVGLFQSVVSVFSVILFSSFKTNKYFNRISKTIDKNEVCFILANGPSLINFLNKGQYPSKGMFAVNHFATSPFFQIVKPDNYIVVDQGMCGRAKPEEISDVDKTYSIINSVSWKMNMFFPSDVYPEIVSKVSGNPNINIVLFNRTPVEGYKGLRHLLYKLNLGMPQPQNVTNAAIFCAINSGYKCIYLLGMEHSWTIDLRVNNNNQVCYYEDHFYDNKTMRVVPDTDITSILLAIARGFKSHLQLNEYAISKGCEIFNLTEESLIDAYQRKSIKEVTIK